MSKPTRQIIACAAVFAFFGSGAGAEEVSASEAGSSWPSRITVEVPLFTRHVPQDAGFNDHNWGALVEVTLDPDWSIVVGDFTNSYYRDTVFAASRYSFYRWDFSSIKVDTGVMLGFDLNGGYKGHSVVDPLLGALSIKVTGNHFSDYALLDGTGVAFTIIPGEIVAINVALAFLL